MLAALAAVAESKSARPSLTCFTVYAAPMIKRVLMAVWLSMASPVFAQAISGTLSATFTGFNEFGQANTHVELNLGCALSCPVSAPELTYSASVIDGHFVAEPTQKAGGLSFSFASAVRTTGMAVGDTTIFQAGSNFSLKAEGVTCQCGGRTGEGGFIDIPSSAVNIPPWIAVPTPSPKAGAFYLLQVQATPRASETVTVTVKGAGADYTGTFPASDFRSTSTYPSAFPKIINVPVFTQAGTVAVTAVVSGGPMSTRTFEVLAGGSSGGGAGGGSGAGGGGEEDVPSGCTSVPMLLPFAMVLLALGRRRS